MAEQRFPVANDMDSNPLDVPEVAAAWRVGRRAGRGRRRSVFDPSPGAQLEIELDAAIDLLRRVRPDGHRPADERGATSTALRTRRARIETRVRGRAVREGAG